jgi:hypothetical protein
MHMIRLLIFLGCLTAQTLAAQTDLGPLLRPLAPAQKSKVLDYLHSLRRDQDAEIACAFEQLDADNQQRAIQFLQASQPHAQGREQRTSVRWNRDTLHFGTLPAGKVLIDSFVVTNTGSKPYVITQHQSACDCTVWRIPSQPILPGESAAIRIEFDSRNKAGRITTGIVLQDNSSPNIRSILYLSGEVLPPDTGQKRPWEN